MNFAQCRMQQTICSYVSLYLLFLYKIFLLTLEFKLNFSSHLTLLPHTALWSVVSFALFCMSQYMSFFMPSCLDSLILSF